MPDIAPYQQPYVITINKTGSPGCAYTGPEVIEGYCCMCGTGCGPEATPCSVALSYESVYEGTCYPTGGSGNIAIENMCDPSCNSAPPGGISCPTDFIATHTINLNCNNIACTDSYLEGDGVYGDGAYECPRFDTYWNGCGSYSMTCPTGSNEVCDQYHECSDDNIDPPENGGSCDCIWDTALLACQALGWTCGDNPCIHSIAGVCGSPNECQTCNVNYIEEIPEILDVDGYPRSYELPTTSNNPELDPAASITLSIDYRRLYGDLWVGIQNYSGADDNADINWIVQNINISYDCNDTQQLSYTFTPDFGATGNYRIIVMNGHSGWDGGSTCTLENGTGGLGGISCPGIQWISDPITVSDDVRPGCTDSCATNYDTNATTDDGSCNFVGCTDSYGTNYFCRDDGGCENSEVCQADGVGLYDFGDIVDDGFTCTFPPVARITTPLGWGGINEGTDLLLQSAESNAFVIAGDSNCAYLGCYGDYTDNINSYSWVINSTSNITAGQTTSFPLSGTGSEYGPFPIPYYDNGGGTITAELTITNSVTSDTTEEIIEISDVDIIGTEISDFAAIYIPGGYEWTYIPCTLPPGTYDLNTIMELSFFISDPTGIDNPQDFQSWVSGDQISTKQCLNANCNFDLDEVSGNYIYGSSTFFEGFGWITGSGTASPDATIRPGGAYMISTLNPGWIKWSV